MTEQTAAPEGGNNGTPAGNQPTAPNVGQQPQNAGQHQNQQGQQNQALTQADLDRVVQDRLARERTKYADYDDLKQKASEFDKLQEANKTELQKLQDAHTAAQVELQGYRVQQVRQQAAQAAGLSPDLAEFITEVDPDKAAEQAKRLAQRMTPQAPPANYQQGARPAPQQQISRDDLIRGMAGRGR